VDNIFKKVVIGNELSTILTEIKNKEYFKIGNQYCYFQVSRVMIK